MKAKIRKKIEMSRVQAWANKWTFAIKPITELIEKYNPHEGWVDPYAGVYSPAEITNDINPKCPAHFHLDALDFVNQLKGKFKGILFDPPYSYRQVSEHYTIVGIKATQLDTSANFYNRVMNGVCDKIELGGYAISFGWNSNAFGKNRGFKIVEIMLVAHGQHHNDTIVTVERKDNV